MSAPALTAFISCLCVCQRGEKHRTEVRAPRDESGTWKVERYKTSADRIRLVCRVIEGIAPNRIIFGNTAVLDPCDDRVGKHKEIVKYDDYSKLTMFR